MLNKLFHSNSPSSTRASKAPVLLTGWKKVVLPTVAAPFSMRSVHAACRLCQESEAAELRLLYVIEVPRSIALKATMPVEDVMAEDAIGAAMTAALSFGVHAHTEVLRVREATEGVAKFVAQQGADLLVLGARADGLRGMPLSLCRDLYEKVSCEVILNYIGTETA